MFGQYEWLGDKLTLVIGKQRVTAQLGGDILTDNEGKLWVRKIQVRAATTDVAPPSDVPPLSNFEVLGNLEIVKLVQAKLPESVILGKIRSSVCRFDLSTDALIRLKVATVSDAIIQAMTDAPQK